MYMSEYLILRKILSSNKGDVKKKCPQRVATNREICSHGRAPHLSR